MSREKLKALESFLGPDIGNGKDRARRLRYLAARQMGLHFVLEHKLLWLADRAAIASGGRAQLAICAELGVLLRSGWADDDVLEVARDLCRRKPRVTAAVAELRSLRQRDQAGSTVDLARALERTLNGYLASHRGMSWARAIEALEFVTDECREAGADELGATTRG